MSEIPWFAVGLFWGFGCFALSMPLLFLSVGAEVLFGEFSRVVDTLCELARLAIGLSPVVAIVAACVALVVP